MILCPNCYSEHIVKNGKSHNKQRFMCDDCLYSFTVYDWPGVPLKRKQTILKAIFRQKSIAKYMQHPSYPLSRTTIQTWLKQLKKNIAEIEVIKTERKWFPHELRMLENIQNFIQKKQWTHPLTTQQLRELFKTQLLDALMLLVQHRPLPRKKVQKNPRKCWKNYNR